MAITAGSLQIRDQVVACNTAHSSGTRLTIRNSGGQGRVADLGGEGLVFGEGFELDAGDTVSVEVQSGDVLYAVSDEVGTTLKILRTP